MALKVRELPGFNRSDAESKFLKFVAAEFHERGTPLRKKFSNKLYANEHAKKRGLTAAEQYKIVHDMDALTHDDLGLRVVLKYGKGWSARGVMLLERVAPGLYFEHMSLQTMSLQQIRNIQKKVAGTFSHKEKFWILEEFIQGPQLIGEIPFDYKFYVFRNRIGFITLNDRNTSPSRLAILDGAFRPLRVGPDYYFNKEEETGIVPVIPRAAAELAWWALKLAQDTDAPMVRIDLYDSVKGPMFGEFTFSPGGPHKRKFIFSHAKLDYFDSLMTLAEKDLKGESVPDSAYPSDPASQFSGLINSLSLEEVRALQLPDTKLYSTLSSVAFNNGSRGALRMSELHDRFANNAQTPKEVAVQRQLSKSWGALRDYLKPGVEYDPNAV
ncbi:MAG: TupA-like ATPgrasp [Idiomarinaceae bacterium HL-53]|nr:MAG: TupA-like ATPgrasp [Idiomarinaceae bacterium HL-53]CUS47078.1 TupA-like ATPgrasp [Idiomarinaceae bacterium HL-53]CUS49600.1 TupA-like ATPgrasp [Idiomarinaceae bacterium HL-53]